MKNVVTLVVVVRFTFFVAKLFWDRGLLGAAKEVQSTVVTAFFKYLNKVPYVKLMVNKELDKVLKDLQKDVIGHHADIPKHANLPAKGMAEKDIKAELLKLSSYGQEKALSGKISGCVYHGGQELSDIINYAYANFTLTNPLHPDVFPGVRQMEADVVSIVLKLFNGGPNAAGTTTSGGTESILMSCKTHRDWAYDVKGITAPEMYAPLFGSGEQLKPRFSFIKKKKKAWHPSLSMLLSIRPLSTLASSSSTPPSTKRR